MILDVATELVELVETDEGVARIVLDVEPLEWRPECLYAIADRDEQYGFESGPAVRQEFDIRLIYVTSNEGEEARKERDPELSAYLDSKRGAYMEALRLAQQREPYWTFGRPASATAPRTLSNRSTALRFTGYRIKD